MIERIETDRLLLRTWQPEDREPFARLNADPEVMEHMITPLTREQSDNFVDRIEEHFAEHGFGVWAVEVPGVSPFVGFVGLMVPAFDAHFTPAVEIGWRLARDAWGQGYASEGARAALHEAFTTVGLDEVVSFTVPANLRSSRVMERIGMIRDPDEDFDHPRVPDGHPSKRHVLYRLQRDRWLQATRAEG
jgi:RimJ/RimL family protein N-acetyltransferase